MNIFLAISLNISFEHPQHMFWLRNKKKMSVKLWIFSYPSFLTFVLGAQKNRLIEMVLLSTHNMFWLRNKEK